MEAHLYTFLLGPEGSRGAVKALTHIELIMSFAGIGKPATPLVDCPKLREDEEVEWKPMYIVFLLGPEGSCRAIKAVTRC